MRSLLALVGPVVAAVVLAGCGGGGGDTSSPSADHNAADVAFAGQMSEHHQQALQMTAMVENRTVDPAFARLAATIASEQAPEIDEMDGWLAAWGEPVPTAGSMGDMGGMSGADGTGSMPGMMSRSQMDGLEHASDATFERRWLTLMIAHHTGALTMAGTELGQGRSADAKALARSISTTQSAEIATMRRMLAG